jgi:hypothetical protein
MEAQAHHWVCRAPDEVIICVQCVRVMGIQRVTGVLPRASACHSRRMCLDATP